MNKEIKKILDEWKKCEAHECWENWQIKKVNQKYKQVIKYIKELESPKWHKPCNCLPKEKQFVIIAVKNNKEIITLPAYFENNGFSLLDNEFINEKVIDWCELPKYK